MLHVERALMIVSDVSSNTDDIKISVRHIVSCCTFFCITPYGDEQSQRVRCVDVNLYPSFFIQYLCSIVVST